MVLLDTNVLVYAIDLRDARKQSIAAAIVERAIAPDSAFVISVQMLAEFANVALAKTVEAELTKIDIPTVGLDVFDQRVKAVMGGIFGGFAQRIRDTRNCRR